MFRNTRRCQIFNGPREELVIGDALVHLRVSFLDKAYALYHLLLARGTPSIPTLAQLLDGASHCAPTENRSWPRDSYQSPKISRSVGNLCARR
jgi:hypothetical protein